jgi:hypothetical protein
MFIGVEYVYFLKNWRKCRSGFFPIVPTTLHRSNGIIKKNFEIYCRKLLLEATCRAPIRMRSWCYWWKIRYRSLSWIPGYVYVLSYYFRSNLYCRRPDWGKCMVPQGWLILTSYDYGNDCEISKACCHYKLCWCWSVATCWIAAFLLIWLYVLSK